MSTGPVSFWSCKWISVWSRFGRWDVKQISKTAPIPQVKWKNTPFILFSISLIFYSFSPAAHGGDVMLFCCRWQNYFGRTISFGVWYLVLSNNSSSQHHLFPLTGKGCVTSYDPKKIHCVSGICYTMENHLCQLCLNGDWLTFWLQKQ